MRCVRRWGLLGGLSAVIGLPAASWSAEPDDPPVVVSQPIFSTIAPVESRPSTPWPRPATPALPLPPASANPFELPPGEAPAAVTGPILAPAPAPRAVAAVAPSVGDVDVEVEPTQIRTPAELPVPRTPATPPTAAPATPPPPTAFPRPSAAPAPETTPPSPAPAAPPTAPTPPGEAAAAPVAPRPGAPSAGEEFARISAMNLAGQPQAANANLGYSVAPVMLGDQSPLAARQALTPVVPTPPPVPTPPQPPVPPVPVPHRVRRPAIFVPWVRGFKIADNQSPRPQDRFFFTFDYFNNLNGVVNQAIGAPVSHEKVYRELFGFEKTFFDGNASIGIRLPLNTLTADSRMPGFGGTNTALGNLTVFAKQILWQDQRGRNLISGGLAITTPNGPTSFAGAPRTFGFHDSQIQPFLGYIFAGDRWYVQGFEAIDVPFDPNDVTMLYNDIGIGYFIYRDPHPDALISGIAPTFETHVNIPLNHRGVFNVNDPAGTSDVVDLTYGVNIVLRHTATLTAGFINPVTGPRPFSYEWQLLLNVYFGRTRARALQAAPTPPLGGS